MEKNEILQNTIKELKATNSKIWVRVANDLSKPTRRRTQLNLSKIEKLAKNDLVIVVPGKVLSLGKLTKKVSVVALQFSETAITKIKAVGGKTFFLNDFVKKNKEGKNVMLLK